MAAKEEESRPDPMLMFNPFELRRPNREVFHETFRDPAHPEVVLALSLRFPDAIDLARVAAETERMTALYITGSDEMPAGPFPLVGGEPVPVSRELFAPACLLYGMQAPPEVSRQPRRWEPEHFVAIAITMPGAWAQIMRRAQEIRQQGVRAEGNSSGPSTAS